MANVIEQVEREGHIINVYESGVEYDLTAGRFVKSAEKYRITKENTHELRRMRQEKSAALLRKRITEAHNGKMTLVQTSAAAFADSGALLYEEVVLNPEAYPRDRLETWRTLGQVAGVLADQRDKTDATPIQQTTELLTVAARLLELVKDNIPAIQVIDIRNDIDGIVE